MREHQGIRRMVHLLKRRDTQPGLAKAVVEALAVLVADNEVNQDHVREEGGVVDIIRLLDARGSKPLAGSAISCITGTCRLGFPPSHSKILSAAARLTIAVVPTTPLPLRAC